MPPGIRRSTGRHRMKDRQDAEAPGCRRPARCSTRSARAGSAMRCGSRSAPLRWCSSGRSGTCPTLRPTGAAPSRSGCRWIRRVSSSRASATRCRSRRGPGTTPPSSSSSRSVPSRFRSGSASTPISTSGIPTKRKFEDIPASERPLVTVTDPPFSGNKWTHVVFTFERFNTGKAGRRRPPVSRRRAARRPRRRGSRPSRGTRSRRSSASASTTSGCSTSCRSSTARSRQTKWLRCTVCSRACRG